jgi:hypothetical protein
MSYGVVRAAISQRRTRRPRALMGIVSRPGKGKSVSALGARSMPDSAWSPRREPAVSERLTSRRRAAAAEECPRLIVPRSSSAVLTAFSTPPTPHPLPLSLALMPHGKRARRCVYGERGSRPFGRERRETSNERRFLLRPPPGIHAAPETFSLRSRPS